MSRITLALGVSAALVGLSHDGLSRRGSFAQEKTNDGAAKPTASEAVKPTSAQLAQWIRDLDDDQLAVRESATVALSKAGKDAISALLQAATEGSLEVTARSVRVLSQLGVSDDQATADSARAALEKLSDSKVAAARERADDVLATLDEREAVRALERLKSLGAYFGTGRFVGGDEAVSYHLVVPKKWSGGNDGIKLLRYLRDVSYISMHGCKVSDDALPHLQKLKHVQRLELYGTEMSEEAVAKLKAALKGTEVDLRGGGLLGVQGQPDLPGCQITVVRPGQAAAKAGIEPGDMILKCDGKAIESFNKLLETIRPKRPGVKVVLSIQRGATTFEKEVTLSEWGEEAPPVRSEPTPDEKP